MTIGSLATGIALCVSFVIPPSLSYAQAPALTPFDKLPDWSGPWAMMGGIVFDRVQNWSKGLHKPRRA